MNKIKQKIEELEECRKENEQLEKKGILSSNTFKLIDTIINKEIVKFRLEIIIN